MTLFNWDTIDTVLLDMDGTLLDLHFDNFFWHDFLPQRYSHENSLPLHQAKLTLNKMITDRIGTLQWYCLDHWSELVGMDIPKLKREVKHKIAVRPYVKPFLDELKALDKHIILITNSHPKGLELKLEETHIDQWLDLVISSHEFKTPKEDQAFWQALQKKVDFDPARTLFVDDTARILKSAETYGIEHLLCISSPDSQKPIQQGIEYPHIAHFDELLPLTGG